MEQKTECLRSMMRVYESPHHSVVAASVGHGAPRFVSSGVHDSQTSPDELIFEIGSITKVFTAILLCRLVEEGKVDPQAPLREMAPELAEVPDWVTPERLTSHTSGLPRIHVPIWKAVVKPLPDDPYAAFSRSDLLAWFHDWRGKPPGARPRHGYSNLAIGLLGEAMAMKEGKPFVELLTEKVINPLGLRDTTDRLDADQQSRFVHPRNPKGKPVSAWTFQAMAAAGCLRSSARDLAQFSNRVIQALNAPETTLDRAICRSSEPIFGLGRRGRMEPTAQCSGWFAIKLGKADPGMLFHNGGTAGSTSALYICPETAEACAVLSNNGLAANLWSSARLSWSNQHRKAHQYFNAS